MAGAGTGYGKGISLPAEWGTAEAVVERRDGALVVLPRRPDLRRVYIEPTARCNLDCHICIRRAWQEAPGEMTMDRVALTTNGLGLEREMAEALVGARLGTLVVSIDRAHLRAYERTGLAGGVDRVLDNLRRVRALVKQRGSMTPRIGLEFVATRSNLGDLQSLPSLAGEVGASFVQVSNLLPYRIEEVSEVLYDREEPLGPQGGWPVASGGWVVWGMARLPRMKWGANRRCRFVEGRALAVGWDGGVSPCYALMHTYPYFIYGRRKEVTRYTLGNVNSSPLGEIWSSEEYVLFRGRVSEYRFPSCVDCGMACAYTAANQDCWGNSPSCADCLWAQEIVQCP